MATYRELSQALGNGGCLVKCAWPEEPRWLWLWIETTPTGYTRYIRRGFGGGVGTITEVLSEMAWHPEKWEIAYEGAWEPTTLDSA